MALRSHTTSVTGRVPATLGLEAATLRSRLAAVEPATGVVELDADIGGVAVRLRTNDRHLASFWELSWRATTRSPQATLYAYTNIAGQAPHAFHSTALDAGLLVNTDYYGQCKSWALGLAGGVRERDGILSIHGASLELGGCGIVIVGGTGAGKSTQVARLCRDPSARLLGDDWVFAERRNGRVRLTQPEQRLYVRTDGAAFDEQLARAVLDAPLENAVLVEGACTSEPCLSGRCMFKQGNDYCAWGHPDGRALVPRAALTGPGGTCDEAWLDLLVVLRRDAADARAAEAEPAKVFEALREGRSSKGREAAFHAYYNPYLLHGTARQGGLFQGSLQGRKTLLLNTAHLGIEATAQRIAAAAGRDPLR